MTRNSTPIVTGRSGRSQVRYQKVLHEDDPRFDPAFDLYEKAFHADERVSRAGFLNLLRRKRLGALSPSNAHLIVALKDDVVVGMGSGRYIASVNIGYIAYLVVDPDHGHQRIGPGIRNHLITAFRHDSELNGQPRLDAVVGEVREDNRWLKILSGRGQVMVLDVVYEQPRLSPEQSRVSLVLYYQPLYPMPDSLPVPYVIKVVRALYREIYGMDNPEERPVFRDFLRRLKGRDVVRHRPLRSPKPARDA
ncbi:MAG TPA: GNAT family N-acetyltransferase [Candidatus Polarisedimenticolia bacterium]|nr:GNAT family N-acetyltransferase [Candidatus Polarisedimenticolia bacterium]